MASTKRRADRADEALKRLVTLSDPDGVASEAYRTLRMSLLYSLVDDPPKVITVTSPAAREGKSTTCANLAVVLAQADKRVALLDCDLRRSTVHKIFGVRNLHGVVDALAAGGDVAEFFHEPLKNLKVVGAGSPPPNPAELLGSSRFSTLLGNLRERFDYVLLDVPPVQLVSDPAIVAAQSDGVLLVIDAQNTRKVGVRRSVRTLQSVGARVIGTVMNNVKASAGAGYYGYTKHGYSRDAG